MSVKTRNMLRDVLIYVAITLVMLAAVSSTWGGQIRLRPAASVEGVEVRLSDLAELDADEAARFGGLVVATLAPGQAHASVSVEQVRRALNDREVNWAAVSLSGAVNCRVGRRGAESQDVDPAADAAAASGAIAAANPFEAVSVDSAATLRGRVTAWLEELAGVGPDGLEVRFADADQRALSGAVDASERLEFTAMSADALGCVPLLVRRYQGQTLVRTQRLTAHVARPMLAVVARRPVARGQILTEQDVELRQIKLDDGRETPVTDMRQAVGQAAGVTLREGTTVLSRHLRPPVLIRRGQLISIGMISGDLVARTTARAMDDGTQGQVIPVRNDTTRQEFMARVTGPLRATVVTAAAAEETAEPGPASPGASSVEGGER